MTDWGKILMVVGVVFLVIGAVMWLSKMFNIPLGRLPGDIHIDRQHVRFYFPITTCLLISGILTLVFWLLRWRRR